MSLSLPNDNMNFVPLDVLTADELNQLVANIDFISNQFPLQSGNIGSGTVGSTQLASSAVIPSKIDYTQMVISGTLSGTDNFTASAWVEKPYLAQGFIRQQLVNIYS